MDIPRESRRRHRAIAWVVAAVVCVIAVAGAARWTARLEPAAPAVERAPLWLDTVKRGEMVREVRGLGTLTAEEVLWVPSTNDGRVEKIMVRPGAVVKKDTVLMLLSNPQLENDALDAQYQQKAAEAGLTDIKVKLDSARLQQQAATAQLKSDYTLAKIEAEKRTTLLKLGLGAEIDARIAQAKSDELANRYAIEQKRLDIGEESIKAQIAAQVVQVDKLRALYSLRRSQVEALRVRAGTGGVLQQLPVEVGQRIAAGAILAKISQPSKLKAELKIPETQARDIALGQRASVDTHNGVIAGAVARIDPASVNGTVTVDVKLEGKLPRGARPDLSVDGTIEIERLRDALYMGRPTFGQPNSIVSLFRLDESGKDATRVQVKLGRISVTSIEILGGLKAGDQVILSDMPQYESKSRIRLN